MKLGPNEPILCMFQYDNIQTYVLHSNIIFRIFEQNWKESKEQGMDGNHVGWWNLHVVIRGTQQH